MKEIYNKLKNNSDKIYRVVAIIMIIILSIGLIKTYKKPYLVDTDLYWLQIFYTLTFILIVQFIVIMLVGQIKRVSKLCCSVIILNMLGMLITFILYSICLMIISYGRIPPLDTNIISIILMAIFWPTGTVWCTHSLISATIFAVFTSIFSTVIQYFFLRNDTKSKKLLLTSLIISSAICYTCITIYFHINY